MDMALLHTIPTEDLYRPQIFSFLEDATGPKKNIFMHTFNSNVD